MYVVTEDWYFWSHRLALAEAAMEKGYNIILATKPGRYAGRIASRGIAVEPLALPRSIGSPQKELAGVISMFRLYRRHRPDLVHHVALKPVVTGSLAGWLAGVPAVVNSFTGLGHLFITDSPASLVFRKLVVPVLGMLLRRKKFHAIVQNEDDLELLTQTGLVQPPRYSLIRGSGVDTNLFRYVPEPAGGPPIVLFASRLLRDKGIVEFVNAAAELRQQQVRARFVIVGDTDPGNPTSIGTAELEEWIRQGLVEWWGYREDMHQVLSQVHIVCLPSYREGLPKVLLEAAACGRPIVTTDVPGCREIVSDGINGYLVPARDPFELAGAIHRLLDSPALRWQMGESGQRRVSEQFGINRVNSATISLYDELLKNR